MTQGVAILSRWPFSISRIFVVDVVVAVAVIIAVIVIPASPGPRPDAAAAAAAAVVVVVVVVVVADCRLNPGLSSFDERRIKVCLGWRSVFGLSFQKLGASVVPLAPPLGLATAQRLAAPVEPQKPTRVGGTLKLGVVAVRQELLEHATTRVARVLWGDKGGGVRGGGKRKI